MEQFSFMDGVMVSIVSMVVVFGVLAALWGLTELVHRVSTDKKPLLEAETVAPVVLQSDKQRETAAVLTAIIAAHETNPGKKFEVVEVKRIK